MSYESSYNRQLDKFYTKPSIAKDCYFVFKDILQDAKIEDRNLLFIEPSAGSGAFLDIIQEPKLGFDISPDDPLTIRKNDFLCGNLLEVLNDEERQKQLVFIGNPPFGTKSKLAIAFVNKALEYSNIVGFVVPLQFRKWSVQSKIAQNARLILDKDLPENAFEFMGKDYKVRCCFQVWALDSFPGSFSNLRLTQKPAIDHPDFVMYQYNRTEQARKFFDYDWDFAVPRQGYLDYSIRAYSKVECDPKHQWLFFRATDTSVLERLKRLDFEKLSRKNIGIPGFGKADVVQEYEALYRRRTVVPFRARSMANAIFNFHLARLGETTEERWKAA
ncbi:hypothetical protein GOL30_23360 [Sinorhizobium medicae]|nr:hypothetical protein [Sinorhizobium medicae]MDX1077647.1 hypothetical protein [Sinorhizobium medicae]